MILLTILDGWGINEKKEGNAFALANTPHLDSILTTYPRTRITPSGTAVGLPKGQMGNSEVGHLNIGAGRIVNQSYQQINVAIEDRSFFSNPELINAIKNAQDHNSALHLMGLLSDGGVHSDIQHVYALLDLAKQHGLRNVYIHCFMDGRDTSPTSGVTFIRDLQEKMAAKGIGRIATISGRYYAMDRDKRWDRVEKAYDAMINGQGEFAEDPLSAVQRSYNNNVTDEFIMPVVITDNAGPVATIQDHDSVIFFNFRPDRAREITYAFVLEDFDGFARKKMPETYYVCFTRYDKNLDIPVAFKPEHLDNVLAEVLANHGKTQLHIAETEKYAHVTFFFNGGIERTFPGEDRILVPSPKVPTYDMKPEMSAYEVTEHVLEAIDSRKYDVIILNYANPDMVGHTGDLQAAIKAMEAVDDCVGKVVERALAHNDVILLTSDHGNLEYMTDADTGEPFTAHTTFDVPIVYVANDSEQVQLRDGVILADIAPTILSLLHIPKPAEMTGMPITRPKDQ